MVLMLKKKRLKYKSYAALIKEVATTVSEERASKCGYDLMMGLSLGTDEKRAKAWRDYIVERKNEKELNEELRDGVWVPAIPL